MGNTQEYTGVANDYRSCIDRFLLYLCRVTNKKLVECDSKHICIRFDSTLLVGTQIKSKFSFNKGDFSEDLYFKRSVNKHESYKSLAGEKIQDQ